MDKRTRGFTLLELLLALTMLGILGLGLSGWMQGVSTVQKSIGTRLSGQSDLNQVFLPLSKILHLAGQKTDLKFEQTFDFTQNNSGAFRTDFSVMDGEAAVDPAEYLHFSAAWNYADMTGTLLKAVPDTVALEGGEKLGFEFRNFAPYIRLKDFNRDYVINSADQAIFDACAAQLEAGQSPTACFDSSCGALSGLKSGNFLAESMADCRKKSAVPFIEFSEDKKIIYVSVRPVRFEAISGTNQTRPVLGQGVTKAIMLEQS